MEFIDFTVQLSPNFVDKGVGVIDLQAKADRGILQAVQFLKMNLTMPLTTPFAIFICGFFISLNVLAKGFEGRRVGTTDGDAVTSSIKS